MGIRFHCPNGHKLNVKRQLAGKRGYCPRCNAKVLVPHDAGGTNGDLPDFADIELPAVDGQDMTTHNAGGGSSDLWYVRPPSGGQFGPVTKCVLLQWVAERRVPPESRLLKDGWTEWLLAADLGNELEGIQECPEPESDASISLEPLPPTITRIGGEIAVAKRSRPRRSDRMTWAVILAALSVFSLIVLIVILTTL